MANQVEILCTNIFLEDSQDDLVASITAKWAELINEWERCAADALPARINSGFSDESQPNEAQNHSDSPHIKEP